MLADSEHVHIYIPVHIQVHVCIFTTNGSRGLEVFREHESVSYERRPDRLKASDARLEFETDHLFY